MILSAGYGIMEDMRDNLGRFTKGHTYWLGRKRPGFKNATTFFKGQTPWNKGLTKDDPRVLSYVSKQGDQVQKTCEWCKRQYSVNRFRDSISKFCSRECRAQSSGLKYQNPESFNKKNHNEYIYLHHRINKRFGKPIGCELCGNKDKKVYHWANKTGNYSEDREDWIRLCPKCHYRYDIERGIRKFAL